MSLDRIPIYLKKKVPVQFQGCCCTFRAGGSRPCSEVNARAWSPVYCTALPHDFGFRIMATQTPRQRVSFTGISGHTLGRSSVTSRHSDKTC
ncbi:hypothetical protein PoB_001206000 [Plakobranchus ocellatus]|uniref:Uncharacterized protein n=1 Tax=Plakobranchus ocellatus TaxID=259542 RepID=A0AAV3YT15_9GAST|nr:hypothetical protein PoB_001206000 [Plakobranchus ocellatus]